MALAQVTFIVDIPDNLHTFTDNSGREYFGAYLESDRGWPVDIPMTADVQYVDEAGSD